MDGTKVAYSTSHKQYSLKVEPLFNDAFVRIFGSERSYGLTRNFINSVLRKAGLEPIEEIKKIEAEHTSLGTSIDCKSTRQDVKIVCPNRVFDLESQRYPADIDNRSLVYGSQLLCESIRPGAGYDEIPQVVVITLLDARPRFPKLDAFLHTSRMMWSSGGGYEDGTDNMMFILIELSKVRARYTELDERVLGDEMLSWLYLLTKGFEEGGEVDTIADKFPTMEEFAHLYGLATNDPRVKKEYDMYVRAHREKRSEERYLARIEQEAVERGMAKGIQQGIQQGIEQGIEQGIQQGIQQGIEQGAAGERARIMKILEDSDIDVSSLDI